MLKLHGVFSRESAISVGTGTTKRKQFSKSYWFVRELPDGLAELRSLDMNFSPQGALVTLPKEQVLTDYLPEPQLSYKLISQPLQMGDLYRESKKYPQAVREYEKVRCIDENNIRANFGMGISLLHMSLADKALYVFRTLLDLEETFEEEHKHLFNEFGICLRHQKLYEETLAYYFKAQALTSFDENLQFNIARAYHEMGDNEQAAIRLIAALDANPFFEEGLAFARFLLAGKAISINSRQAAELENLLHVAGMDHGAPPHSP